MAIRETPVKSESLRGTTPEGEPCEKTLERDLYTLLAIGPDFYRLPRNTGTVTLHKTKWRIPDEVRFMESGLVPLRAGEDLTWRMA